MRRRNALILLLVLLASCRGEPIRAPEWLTGGRRLILPVVLINAELGKSAAWVWPQHGYGYTSAQTVSNAALIDPRGTPTWFYTWEPACASGQIPMIWRDWTNAVLTCDDGRPLLLLNEPERSDQANLTPAQAADVVHRAAQAWRGELYCCGTMAHETAYVDAVVASYRARFGAWPCTGWHVHLYNNRAEWQANVADISFTQRETGDLDRFIAHVRAAGLLGRGVVVSEYGALSAWYPRWQVWHEPEDLVPALWEYERAFRQRPDVLAWAWFSTFYPQFNASDLLYADGGLTPLGAAWRQAAGQ